MAKLSNIRTDLDLEREGLWEEFEGIRFKIGLLKHGLDAEIESLGAPFRHKLRDDRLTEEEAERLLLSALGDRVVTDWEDMEDETGAPIPWTPEKCRELLADPEYALWREWVMAKAKDRSRFLQSLREDALGN